MTGHKEVRGRRNDPLLVRLSADEKELIRRVGNHEGGLGMAATLRRLVYQEARRLGLLAGEAQRTDIQPQ